MRALKRLNAWIDGAALRDVDARLHIVDINENAPEQELTWATAPARNGQRLLTRTRASKRIVIEFDSRELFDLAARAAMVDAVNAWAGDGMLEVSYRPGQRIPVVLSKPAEFGGARDVTGTYELDFEAAVSPFWEDITPTVWTQSGSNGSGTMILPGSVPTVPEIEIKPTGGTLSSLTVGFGGKSMTFSGLGVSTSSKLIIGHDERGILYAKAGSTSKLATRTAASADDFEAGPGSVAVSYVANTACAVTFRARGRYR